MSTCNSCAVQLKAQATAGRAMVASPGGKDRTVDVQLPVQLQRLACRHRPAPTPAARTLELHVRASAWADHVSDSAMISLPGSRQSTTNVANDRMSASIVRSTTARRPARAPGGCVGRACGRARGVWRAAGAVHRPPPAARACFRPPCDRAFRVYVSSLSFWPRGLTICGTLAARRRDAAFATSRRALWISAPRRMLLLRSRRVPRAPWIPSQFHWRNAVGSRGSQCRLTLSFTRRYPRSGPEK